jgi:hypothetical protein
MAMLYVLLTGVLSMKKACCICAREGTAVNRETEKAKRVFSFL